jgi:hypothetical protein
VGRKRCADDPPEKDDDGGTGHSQGHAAAEEKNVTVHGMRIVSLWAPLSREE